MHARIERLGPLAIVVFAASIGACKQPSRADPAPRASATAAAAPDVYEPIDKDFKGCEGG